jgi:hypothetical protein
LRDKNQDGVPAITIFFGGQRSKSLEKATNVGRVADLELRRGYQL